MGLGILQISLDVHEVTTRATIRAMDLVKRNAAWSEGEERRRNYYYYRNKITLWLSIFFVNYISKITYYFLSLVCIAVCCVCRCLLDCSYCWLLLQDNVSPAWYVAATRRQCLDNLTWPILCLLLCLVCREICPRCQATRTQMTRATRLRTSAPRSKWCVSAYRTDWTVERSRSHDFTSYQDICVADTMDNRCLIIRFACNVCLVRSFCCAFLVALHFRLMQAREAEVKIQTVKLLQEEVSSSHFHLHACRLFRTFSLSSAHSFVLSSPLPAPCIHLRRSSCATGGRAPTTTRLAATSACNTGKWSRFDTVFAAQFLAPF